MFVIIIFVFSIFSAVADSLKLVMVRSLFPNILAPKTFHFGTNTNLSIFRYKLPTDTQTKTKCLLWQFSLLAVDQRLTGP